MSHDAKVLLGRDVRAVTRAEHRKSSYQVVASSNDRLGNIYLYLMGKNGRTHRILLADVEFCQVWDKEARKLVDVE